MCRKIKIGERNTSKLLTYSVLLSSIQTVNIFSFSADTLKKSLVFGIDPFKLHQNYKV